MNKNDTVVLDITATSSDGYGIGRHEGLAVFVPNSAEGDKIKAKILKLKKTYAYGKVEELISPSPDRIVPDCEAFLRCGGCVYRHIKYEKECEIKSKKVEDCIRRIGGIDLSPKEIISAENVIGYRNKAQLPISTGGKVGFFAPHSHRIIETENCLLSPSVFNEIAAVFTEWVQKNNISVYNEAEHKGLLRHLYMRIGFATNEIMVVPVINGDTLPKSTELIEKLKSLLGEKLCSFQVNINKKDTNVILGETCKVLYGKSHITDVLCGVKVRISPLSFYQVNREMTEKLYKKAAEYIKPDGKNIIDLYCGAGTIGLSVADRAKTVIGVEIVPEAVEDAKQNAIDNEIENAEFICADAEKAAKQLSDRGITADAVFLDPPRKGCSEELLRTVANDFCPERIVYISCDPATLARDCAILKELNYTLKEYTPVDLFPRTHHVECCALLLRNSDINL